MPARVIALNGDGRNLLSEDREERHRDVRPQCCIAGPTPEMRVCSGEINHLCHFVNLI